jgi:hypothetical protein
MLFLLKYDGSGNLQWENTWGGSNYDWAYGVAVGSDGLYVAGVTDSYGATGDVFLLKYDGSGNLQWENTWRGSSNSEPHGVAVGSDGIYVAGETYSYETGSTDAFLLKYDGSGNLQWSKTWGGSSKDRAWGIAVWSDGIYIAGDTESYGAGGSDVFLLKYDGSGNLQWSKTWGGSNYDGALCIAVGSDGIYVAGYTDSYGTGRFDALLLKYAASTPPAPTRWPLIAGIVGAIVVIGVVVAVYVRKR